VFILTGPTRTTSLIRRFAGRQANLDNCFGMSSGPLAGRGCARIVVTDLGPLAYGVAFSGRRGRQSRVLLICVAQARRRKEEDERGRG